MPFRAGIRAAPLTALFNKLFLDFLFAEYIYPWGRIFNVARKKERIKLIFRLICSPLKSSLRLLLRRVSQIH